MDTLRSTPPEWMTAAETERWYQARERRGWPSTDLLATPVAIAIVGAVIAVGATVWLAVAWLVAR